jgi:hypothetical protein
MHPMSYVYYIKKHFTNNNFSEYAFSFVLVLHNLHIPNSNTGLKQIHNAHAWQHTYETTYKYIEEWKTNLMSLSILFHFLCTQHVSDINISIIRSLRLCCWITTSVYCSQFFVCWRFGVAGFEWCPCCRLKPATRMHPAFTDQMELPAVG